MVNIYRDIIISRNVQHDHSHCFWNWLCGCRLIRTVVFFSYYPFYSPLPSAVTSVGQRSFHGEVTHIFVPEGSGSLSVLCVLSCYVVLDINPGRGEPTLPSTVYLPSNLPLVIRTHHSRWERNSLSLPVVSFQGLVNVFPDGSIPLRN